MYLGVTSKAADVGDAVSRWGIDSPVPPDNRDLHRAASLPCSGRLENDDTAYDRERLGRFFSGRPFLPSENGQDT